MAKADRETGKLQDGPSQSFRCFDSTGETWLDPRANVEMYGPYKSTEYKDLPGFLPGTAYAFIDKAADLNHPELDFVLESFLDGKVGMITYANSDETRLKAGTVQAALILNGPEAAWYGPRRRILFWQSKRRNKIHG